VGEETAAHLYRIAQEAVRNAVRHGRPSQVTLSLRTEGNRLVLRIWDDGSGIHPLARRGFGTGLRDMHRRAAAIGAQLRVGPPPHHGTLALCELEPDPGRAESVDASDASLVFGGGGGGGDYHGGFSPAPQQDSAGGWRYR
jgi:nitrate/nitrite-specific signal transduction histidine kinase